MNYAEAASRTGVGAQTLRRWVTGGLIPQFDGEWTPVAIGQAKIVARMREKGHTIADIRAATLDGRLALGFAETLFDSGGDVMGLRQAARACGLSAGLIEQILGAFGFSSPKNGITEDELQLLRYAAAVLDSGFPLEAMLQVMRVYGQAMAQVADVEVRLFHMYVHEPLIRSGTTAGEIAQEMEGLSRAILPLTSPILDHVHHRFLQHFIEQDVVGHMELEHLGDGSDLGRIRVAIAFADLAGYTRLTEQEGEQSAVDAVERFIEGVEQTLPEEARVIKTIGDEVMIAGADAGALVDWAVGFQAGRSGRPLPRIGIHSGLALYRDGDYYGRDVNIAARVAARSAGGEVLVTRPVVEACGSHLEFERIAEVMLKGFSEPTEVFLAGLAGD
jgi:adenylate cyclase